MGLMRPGCAISFFSLVRCFEDIPSATRRSSSFVVSAWDGWESWRSAFLRFALFFSSSSICFVLVCFPGYS
jgi:hypothetical protein